MIVREINVKSILSRSQIYEYAVNPYVGCQHSCTYCYARFMKRFTGHKEPWGQFVDVKVNAPNLLRQQVLKKKKGTVWVSGVCDPYQPLEGKYKLTRQCLEILAEHDWSAVVQTRSPLVLRDLDVIRKAKDFEVGFSVTTADDGIRTYAMIAPMLPGAEDLPDLLQGKVDRILLDRMNYSHADWVYRKHNLM